MSEANNTWRVDVDGVEHEVRLDHTQMMKHTVTVDGDTVVDFRRWGFISKPIEFDVAGHPAVMKVTAKYGGFAWGSELTFKGRYVEPLRR